MQIKCFKSIWLKNMLILLIYTISILRYRPLKLNLIYFTLLLINFTSNPFSDGEIYKITFVLNNLFKVTSLVKEGWDKKCIYKMHVIVELSQFMSTFEFFNEIGFNFLRNEIVESNVFSLYNGCFFS